MGFVPAPPNNALVNPAAVLEVWASSPQSNALVNPAAVLEHFV